MCCHRRSAPDGVVAVTVCTGIVRKFPSAGAAVMPQPALLLRTAPVFWLLIGLLHRNTGIGCGGVTLKSVLVPAQPESNKVPSRGINKKSVSLSLTFLIAVHKILLQTLTVQVFTMSGFSKTVLRDDYKHMPQCVFPPHQVLVH